MTETPTDRPDADRGDETETDPPETADPGGDSDPSTSAGADPDAPGRR